MGVANRACGGLAVLAVAASVGSADDPLSRVEIGKLGKAATALVEVKATRTYGSAFCIHPSGLFLTNEHVLQGNAVLVLNPGQPAAKEYPAKVVRASKELDLALVRIEGAPRLPALPLGTEDGLAELMEVVAFGFPFGTALATDRGEYPAISVNAGSVTALRRKGDQLHRIQLDVALNPGNSGGPVLDRGGKVVGMVVAGVQGSGVNFAIPVGALAGFVARPEVEFDPPALTLADIRRPVTFEARVMPLLAADKPLTAELLLKVGDGPERTHRMEATGDRFRAAVVPLPPPAEPPVLQVLATFNNGLLNATTAGREFRIGERAANLSEVRSLRLQPTPKVVFHDGTTAGGPVSGLDAVPVRLGDRTAPVDLTRAVEVRFAPAVGADTIRATLVVRQGDKEVYRQTDTLLIQGLLPGLATPPDPGHAGIARPALEGNKVDRKLPAPVNDLAVGGGGRYLVLHLAGLKRLAVFDVNVADVVGYIPVKEDGVLFTAGRDEVVLALPGAGTLERWSLTTRELVQTAKLPFDGVVKGIVMGSASKGPLLVHWAKGTQPLDRATLAMLHGETLREIPMQLTNTAAIQYSSYRDLVHLRAAAGGEAFGLWGTSHSPSGMAVIVMSGGAGAAVSYAHQSVGHVLPGPDGKTVFTWFGAFSPVFRDAVHHEIPAEDILLPACHGASYLRLPQTGGVKTGNKPYVQPPPSQWPKMEGAPEYVQPTIPPARVIKGIDPRTGRPIYQQEQGPQPPKGPLSPVKAASKPTGTGTVPSVHLPNRSRAVATLPDLDLPLVGSEAWIKHDFTLDKRVLLIPNAGLVITIPGSGDRLVLHRYGGDQ